MRRGDGLLDRGRIALRRGRKRPLEIVEHVCRRVAQRGDRACGGAGRAQLGGDAQHIRLADGELRGIDRRRERRAGSLETGERRARLNNGAAAVLERAGRSIEPIFRCGIAGKDERRPGTRLVDRGGEQLLQPVERRVRASRRLRHGHNLPRVARRIGIDRIGRTPSEEQQTAQGGQDSQQRRTPAQAAYHLLVDRAVIRGLPKAELHQHLDGAVRPATAVELGGEIGLRLDLDEARRQLVAPAHGATQAELLAYFEVPLELLQTGDALRRVSAELVNDLAADGVTYAEIRWAPRLHLRSGLSVASVIEAVADGVEAGRSRLGPGAPVIGLIVTAMRSHPPMANVELARTAAEHGSPVVGFDLAGPEAAFPAPPHAAAFRAAEAAGLRLTAHAGEVPGSERIREAVRLGVERIAHGVTVGADTELVDLVRDRDLTLDLCPTSNVQAGIVASLAEHPLAALHRAGVSVTLSTDDRTVSDTTLTDEIIAVTAALSLEPEELAAIALNGFDRAFAASEVIAPLRQRAAEAWQAWAAGVIA